MSIERRGSAALVAGLTLFSPSGGAEQTGGSQNGGGAEHIIGSNHLNCANGEGVESITRQVREGGNLVIGQGPNQLMNLKNINNEKLRVSYTIQGDKRDSIFDLDAEGKARSIETGAAWVMGVYLDEGGMGYNVTFGPKDQGGQGEAKSIEVKIDLKCPWVKPG